jgi:hypothetical protein
MAARSTQTQPGDVHFAEMSNDAYDDFDPAKGGTGTQSETDLGQWKRLEVDGDKMRIQGGARVDIDAASLKDDSSGFQAAIYSDGQGHYVVAYAGSDFTDVTGDAKTDFEQGLGLKTRQYEQAIALGKQVQAAVGRGNVAFTGHSLGGGLAATTAVATGETGVTFNAAGVSNETLRDLHLGNPNDLRQQTLTNGQIRNYSVDSDLLTTLDDNGAPRQLGTPWHSTWKDPRGKGLYPTDLLPIHGGGDEKRSYVEALAPGVVLRPGTATDNPYMAGTLDLVFTPLGPAQPLRPLEVGVIGNVANADRGVLKDLLQIGGGTAHELGDIARRPDALDPVRAQGALEKAGLDAAGSVAGRTNEFGGRMVTTVTDNLGSAIRGAGRDLGLPSNVADAGGRTVENAGNVTREGFDLAGRDTRAAFDAAGSVADWGANRAADLGDGAAHLVASNWKTLTGWS